MKYYAVIDTNVLVSAVLKWDSVPGKIIALVFDERIIPVLNAEIVKEYRAVLMRPKFHLTENIVEDIVGDIEESGVYFDVDHHSELGFPDSKDEVFYEVTMDSRRQRETYLVTGNLKHFPEEVFVVTPKQMLDIILESDEQA